MCLALTLGVFKLQAQGISARFLLVQPSAEARALGGCGLNLERSDFESYYNPSLLGMRDDVGLSASLVQPISGFGQSSLYIQTASKITSELGLSLSMHYAEQAQRPRTDNNGSILGTYRATDYCFKVSGGYRLNSRLFVGTSISRISVNIAPQSSLSSINSTRNYFAIDLGCLYLAAPNLGALVDLPTGQSEGSFELSDLPQKCRGLCIAARVRNIGTTDKEQFNDVSIGLPTSFTLSLSYTALRGAFARLDSYVEVEDRFNENSIPDLLRIGIDVSFLRFFHLRCGLHQGVHDDEHSSLSYGFGLKSRYFRVDYARFNTALLATDQFSAGVDIPL